MAFYAFVNKSNKVTEVIVGRGSDELVQGVHNWETHYGEFRGQKCLETSAETYGGTHYTDGEPSADQTKSLRYNYAGIGYSYDENRDAFIPPQPFESWVLDEDTCLWVAPIAYPAEGAHTWDEQAGDWEEVPDETV